MSISQADFDDLKTNFEAFKKKGSGKVPRLELPAYEGRADEKTFREFLDKFYLVGNLYGWDEARCCQVIATCLRGEALAVYQTLPDATKTDWATLCSELGAKLVTGDDDVQQQQALNRRFQHPHESVAEYGLAIKALVKRAFPTTRQIGTAKPYTEEFQAHKAINHFIAGFKPNIKEHILRGTRPVSLEAAIAAAITEEQTQRALREDYARNDTTFATIRLEAANEELKTKVNDLQKKFEQVSFVHNAPPTHEPTPPPPQRQPTPQFQSAPQRNSLAQRTVDPRKRSWRPKPNRVRRSTYIGPDQAQNDHDRDHSYSHEPFPNTASSPDVQRCSSPQTHAILPILAILTLIANVASANIFGVQKSSIGIHVGKLLSTSLAPHPNSAILDIADDNAADGTTAWKQPSPDAIYIYEDSLCSFILSMADAGCTCLTPFWMPLVQRLRTPRSHRSSINHQMFVLTTLLTASMPDTAEATTLPLTETGRPCRLQKPNIQRTSPTKPSTRFFRRPISRKLTPSTRSSNDPAITATTANVIANTADSVAHPQADHTTVSCQCRADFVQVVLLLTIVIGIPVAVWLCIVTVRQHDKNNRIRAKDAEAAGTAYAAEAAEDTFAADTASDADAIGIHLQHPYAAQTKTEVKTLAPRTRSSSNRILSWSQHHHAPHDPARKTTQLPRARRAATDVRYCTVGDRLQIVAAPTTISTADRGLSRNDQRKTFS